MQKTAISWSDYSSNPIRARHRITGKRGWNCTKVSPGCAHCYSEALNLRLGTGLSYEHDQMDEVEWTLIEHELDAIMRHQGTGRVFVGDMTDLWHERVPDTWLDKIFAVMARSPHLTFQLLTKRADRMYRYIREERALDVVFQHGQRDQHGQNTWPLPNVHLGVSVENQRMADERIPWLIGTPAAVRFLSCEPLLEHIDLDGRSDPRRPGVQHWDYLNPSTGHVKASLHWIICGGESGKDRRPMQLEWLESLVKQCQAAQVPVWVKQASALKPGQQGRIPDHLWIHEFPHEVSVDA